LTYKKFVRQSYVQVRRKPTSGKLRAMSTKTSTIRQSSQTAAVKKQQRFVANLMDLSRFLARYLSGKNNVMVSAREGTQGYSIGKTVVKGKEFYNINVPNWQKYDLPLKGFDKYRIYRSGLWHESMHAKYTPDKVYTHGDDQLEHDVTNVIEDRRIEDLGVEEWRGYLPERLYTNAYGYALRPDVGDLWQEAQSAPSWVEEDMGMKRARYEAFLQKLLTGKIKGEKKLPDAERDRINFVVKKVEKDLEEMKKHKDKPGEIYGWLSNLTKEVIKDLDLKDFAPSRVSSWQGSSWDDTFTEKYADQQQAKPSDIKEGMEEYFDEVEKEAEPTKPSEKPSEKGTKGTTEDTEKTETEKESEEESTGIVEPSEIPEGILGITKEDVRKAREGTDQVEKEYNQVQKEEIDDTPYFVPLSTAVPPEIFRDQKFITKMNDALREWKTGRREIVGERGARLSIPHYIRNQEEPFVTRIRKSARGRKILVVADFSGSMVDREEDYKKALISSMEVLDGIGSKTALFGFGGEQDGDRKIFFRIKRFEDPKWKPTHSAKTAALTASYNSTPTARAYRALEGYIKKHRPDVTVTVTDGAPDHPNEVAEVVKDLKRHTRMVAFGIGPGVDENLKQFGYHKVFGVENVHDVPPKLVRLMAPT